jgi:tRNA/tmRNA/rRNA uracil-C5-methylase (TrmA/RlmC/RlmD family)
VKKEIDLFFKKIAPTLSVPLHAAAILGWRTRAKLAVRGKSTHPQIGLFHRGSHDVVDIPDCPLHHPAINHALSILKQKMIQEKIEPYCEKNHRGLLRYIQLVVERKTNKVQLVLVLNATTVDPKIKHFFKHEFWHSIWVNLHTKPNNAIFSEKWQILEGEPYLFETLCGIEFCFHPASFSQAHLPLFEQMLICMKKEVLPNKRVVEFYAGVGCIGLSLLEKSQSLVCSEINPFAQECFEKTVAKLPQHLQEKASFRTGSTEQCIDLLEEAEVVIVDPPRKGLDRQFRERLKNSPSVQQILYVSCGFSGFQRDCLDLIESGWQLEKAAGYLLFPGSDHIEMMASFKK